MKVFHGYGATKWSATVGAFRVVVIEAYLSADGNFIATTPIVHRIQIHGPQTHSYPDKDDAATPIDAIALAEILRAAAAIAKEFDAQVLPSPPPPRET